MQPFFTNTDIYLLDQIQRGRIKPYMRILDAGCGVGRNSELFIRNNMDIYGVDNNRGAIENVHFHIAEWNPDFDKGRYKVADICNMPFPDAHFDFIISSAVLHFAEDRTHFTDMFVEMQRVLAPGGILWIRMTAKHTIEHIATHIHDDIYRLPDGSTRYLLDRDYLDKLMAKYKLRFLDPFKTVNVDDIRTMAVIVLIK